MVRFDKPLRIAYADPPYIGRAREHYGRQPDYGGEVDHAQLIARLVDEFPSGWALSCHTPSLRQLLPLCPNDVRIGAWVKPYASSRPGVMPVYAWEPVIWRGGRKRAKGEGWLRDWVSANITQLRHEHGLRKVAGTKPETFCFWLFQLLNLKPGDDFVDLFPGSGAVSRAWEKWQRQLWAA